MPNILLKKSIVPEFVQKNCTRDHILAGLKTLLLSEIQNQQFFDDVKAALSPVEGESTTVSPTILPMLSPSQTPNLTSILTPSQKAAQVILRMIKPCKIS